LRHRGWGTLIQVSLEQAAEQFAPVGFKQVFELAVGHVLGLRSAQTGHELIKVFVSSQISRRQFWRSSR
jgi:hypothetical protein